MRGPASDYAAPPIYVYPGQPKPGLRFSRTEIFQLFVAVLALSLAMTLLFVRGLLFAPSGALVLALGFYFAMALLSVGTGMALHELAHKAVAQRFGHWAEFRYNPMGLMLAFVFAFLGFLYGAPGATWISGTVTREQNGRISAAGPATNIGLAVVFLGASSAIASFAPSLILLSLIVGSAAFLNLVLAGFNMIPILPLDGAKVWAWNKGVFALIVVAVIVLFVMGFSYGLLPLL